MIDSHIDQSRRASLTLNSSLTSIQSNLVAHESTVNVTVSALVNDFAAFSGAVREQLSRPPDSLAGINLPRTPRTRLAVTLDDLERLSLEFRHELHSFGALERSIWKRLIGDELTRRFYERVRGDVSGFSAHQLREFVDGSPGGQTDDELDDYSLDGADDQLEDRYGLFNADLPTMDFAVVRDDVTRVLDYYADTVDVHSTVKEKIEDLLTEFDDLTDNVESLRSDCGPLSDDDFNNLIR